MTGMEHAIERATEAIRHARAFQAAAAFGVPEGSHRECAEYIARALAEAGLLAPAPLAEEQRSAHTVRETAAHYASRLQRLRDQIMDSGYRRSVVDVIALESVQGFLDRIARDDLSVYAADAVNRAEGGGRADQ